MIVAIAATLGNLLVGWDSSTIAGINKIYSYSSLTFFYSLIYICRQCPYSNLISVHLVVKNSNSLLHVLSLNLIIITIVH